MVSESPDIPLINTPALPLIKVAVDFDGLLLNSGFEAHSVWGKTIKAFGLKDIPIRKFFDGSFSREVEQCYGPVNSPDLIGNFFETFLEGCRQNPPRACNHAHDFIEGLRQLRPYVVARVVTTNEREYTQSTLEKKGWIDAFDPSCPVMALHEQAESGVRPIPGTGGKVGCLNRFQEAYGINLKSDPLGILNGGLMFTDTRGDCAEAIKAGWHAVGVDHPQGYHDRGILPSINNRDYTHVQNLDEARNILFFRTFLRINHEIRTIRGQLERVAIIDEGREAVDQMVEEMRGRLQGYIDFLEKIGESSAIGSILPERREEG